MASGKRVALLLTLALTVFVVALFAAKQVFDRVPWWPVAPSPVVKPYSEITKQLPPPRTDLSINLVVIPYLQFNASDKAVIERQREYWAVLQRNLNHEFVSRVHVLTTNAREMLQHLKLLTNQSKLIVSEVNSVDTMRDPFDYISKNLVDKDVVYTSGDVYLGGGFDQVDPMVLTNRNMMYAITRRVAPEEKKKCGELDYCLESHYIGCHDTFLFHLTEPLPEKFLKHLEHKLINPGIENVLLWAVQNELNYCTLNPCTILETFHVHCSNVRNDKGKRINHAGYSGSAPFTKKMVC